MHQVTAATTAPGHVIDDDLSPGDVIHVTLGRESFYPKSDGNGFDVGPISISVSIRKDEQVSAAYLRGRKIAEAIFEAEFKLKNTGYYQRLGEVDQRNMPAREST